MNLIELPIINSQRWLSLEDFQGETWKVVEISPQYMISNYGRVKSIERTVCHFRKGRMVCRKYESKILRIIKDVYYRVGLKNNNKEQQKQYSIHRLIAMAFIPNPQNKPFVNHIDGNKHNNTIENLEWCTYRENLDHAIKSNLVPYGVRSPKSKLKEDEVVVIKKYLSEGVTCKDIAKKFNVNISTISLIKKGKNWWRIPFIKTERKYKLWDSVKQTTIAGQIVGIYDSVLDAHIKTGYSATQIRRACKGERDSFQGFKWEFVSYIKTYMEL